MNNELHFYELITYSVILGIGATAVMDLWALLLQRVFSIPPLNYALVGRWLGYMPTGVFYHANITKTKPIAAERMLGWISHYLIGVGFAAAFLTYMGTHWLLAPTLPPALILGVVTLVFPFFIMQPSFGLGMAALNTPKPNVARARSLMAHLSFGFGIYFTAIILK